MRLGLSVGVGGGVWFGGESGSWVRGVGCCVRDMGFRVEGAFCEVWGVWCGVQGVWVGIWDVEFGGRLDPLIQSRRTLPFNPQKEHANPVVVFGV